MKVVNDVASTVREFLDKVFVAQQNGDEWIEVSDDIIKHYQPKGLGDAGYFIYGTPAVKVCPTGGLERAQNYLDRNLGQEKHGKVEGFREQV